jgi:hypothetical protein
VEVEEVVAAAEEAVVAAEEVAVEVVVAVLCLTTDF